MKSLNTKNKRDGQHETPHLTSAPSDRELRIINRSRIKQVQAYDEKKATANVNDHFEEAIHVRNNPSTFESSVQSSKENKSPSETSIPVQHHSTTHCSESKVNLDSKSSEANDCNVSKQNQHPNRKSNLLPNFERNKKDKLQLPSSNSPIWKEIEAELKEAIPQIMTKQVMKSLKPQALIEKYDKWLYEFFHDKFGTVPPTEKKPTFVRKPHKGLLRLREDKKRIRKTIRALEKNGLKNTPECKKLQTERLVLIRKHNRLRVALINADKKRAATKAKKIFKQDHWKYTKNLFHPPSSIGSPSFTKEAAENYFTPLYKDEERDYQYEPHDEMQKPDPPVNIFNLKCPTFQELRQSARRKRNGASAGVNGLTYLIYKKCPSVIYYLYLITCKIWVSKNMPTDWAVTYIALIAKSSDLDQPGEFRPIAVGNTDGKIFFTIIADRLQHYMISNKYLKLKKQKGFLAGMSGCLEHSFVLWEAFRNAKKHKKSIVTTWIDLANAYGSVRHNLIQFALNWYHVPKLIQDLIFNYYESLCAKIVTENWSTGFFLFDIGCFQGCVLSAILFDCVFNLLLDFLEPMENLGYQFRAVKAINMDQAYADDLSLTTKDAVSNQKVIDRTDIWLKWTKTMAAKPKKYVSTAYRQFPRDAKPFKNFTPITNTVYAPYDPLLIISGKPIRHILDPTNDDDFKSKHFKFVGRWISIHLNEHDVQVHVKKEFLRLMNLIDNDLTDGFMKAWMYQHGILSNIAWPFLVQDLPLSLALDLDVITHRFLKKWTGLYRQADLGILYRSHERFGLGLTKVSSHFKKMGVVKCMLLKNSVDPNIKLLYHNRLEHEAGYHTEWRASKQTQEVENIVSHKIRYKGQTDTIALGKNRYTTNHSIADLRKLCSKVISESDNEEMWKHSHTLNMQGLWSTWFEHTFPLDFSWHNLIFGPGKKIISFLLNASINSVPSPYLLKLIGYKDSSKCNLCNREPCNTSHILAGCPQALRSKRYTWRHDSVLLTLLPELEKRITDHNQQAISSDTYSPPIPISSSFVKSGTKPSLVINKAPCRQNLLTDANDWQLLIDFEHQKLVFPPQICSTNKRPDIIIWSQNHRTVLIIELTVPADENIVAAQIRKTARYQELSDLVKSINNWNSKIITIEVGARGFVAKSMNSFLRSIGFSHKESSSVCKSISMIVARCSHHIFAQRNNTSWHKGPLLVPYKPDEPNNLKD